jgi:hypothetical protein
MVVGNALSRVFFAGERNQQYRKIETSRKEEFAGASAAAADPIRPAADKRELAAFANQIRQTARLDLRHGRTRCAAERRRSHNQTFGDEFRRRNDDFAEEIADNFCEERFMIELKEAVEKAKDFIADFFDKPEKIQVEAFSLSEDKKSWNVTYSFWRKADSSNQLQTILGITGSKIYKTIQIDTEKGEVIGMKAGIAENLTETV